MKNPIIVLTGPTASGKTRISFDIAKKYNCEIICTDSMTIYRHLDIGTDKPIREKFEQEPATMGSDGSYIIRGIKHHLIDIIDPDEDFNVAIFKERVKRIIKEIYSRGRIPLLVGGSVMYIDALMYNYQFPDVKPDPKLREYLETLSAAELFMKLCEIDPDCEWTVDKNNKRRLIRAIEIHYGQGNIKASKDPLPANALYLAVSKDRTELYSKINRRVDEMFNEGLVKETSEIYQKYGSCKSLEAAGYKQIIQHLSGDITLEQAIEKTKQAHRNYAKRQLTWLNKNSDVVWISDVKAASENIQKFLSHF